MRALLLVIIVVLAGCATQRPDLEVTEASAPEAVPVPEWSLQMSGCTGVAGVSVYPRDAYTASTASPQEPFVPADIRSDIGGARIASANGAGWFTAIGEVAGHWHFAFDCEELDWGFVGIAIEPPAFDDAPVDRNVLLAVWSWPAQVVEAMHPIGHATQAMEITATLDPTAMTMLLRDTAHGRYEGVAPRGQAMADADAGTTRFWMLLPAEGHPNHHDQVGPFRPVAFDLAMTSHAREVLLDSVGVFAHTETDHHAPLPGLGGNDAAVAWSGFGATLTAGPQPDVLLNATWVH